MVADGHPRPLGGLHLVCHGTRPDGARKSAPGQGVEPPVTASGQGLRDWPPLL